MSNPASLCAIMAKHFMESKCFYQKQPKNNEGVSPSLTPLQRIQESSTHSEIESSETSSKLNTGSITDCAPMCNLRKRALTIDPHGRPCIKIQKLSSVSLARPQPIKSLDSSNSDSFSSSSMSPEEADTGFYFDPRLEQSMTYVCNQSDIDLISIVANELFIGFLMKQDITRYFHITAELESGKHGLMFKATCIHNNITTQLSTVSMTVAIKATKTPIALDQFENQVKIENPSVLSYLQTLKHDNVAQFYAAYIQQDQSNLPLFNRWLIFEYIESINLNDILHTLIPNSKNNFQIGHTHYLLKQISIILQFLDQHLIFHQDLHSKNLLYCTQTHKLKLIDFGFAIQCSERSIEFKTAHLLDTQRSLTNFACCFIKGPLISQKTARQNLLVLNDPTYYSQHFDASYWHAPHLTDDDAKTILIWSYKTSLILGHNQRSYKKSQPFIKMLSHTTIQAFHANYQNKHPLISLEDLIGQ